MFNEWDLNSDGDVDKSELLKIYTKYFSREHKELSVEMQEAIEKAATIFMSKSD